MSPEVMELVREFKVLAARHKRGETLSEEEHQRRRWLRGHLRAVLPRAEAPIPSTSGPAIAAPAGSTAAAFEPAPTLITPFAPSAPSAAVPSPAAPPAAAPPAAATPVAVTPVALTPVAAQAPAAAAPPPAAALAQPVFPGGAPAFPHPPAPAAAPTAPAFPGAPAFPHPPAPAAAAKPPPFPGQPAFPQPPAPAAAPAARPGGSAPSIRNPAAPSPTAPPAPAPAPPPVVEVEEEPDIASDGYTPSLSRLFLEQYYSAYAAEGYAFVEGPLQVDLSPVDPREIELYRAGLISSGGQAPRFEAQIPEGLAFLDDFMALYERSILPPPAEDSEPDSDDPTLLIPGKRKVTVHLLNGTIKRGTIRQLERGQLGFALEPIGPGRVEEFSFGQLKALFVHTGRGAPPAVGGRSLTVMFTDRRSVQGMSDDYAPGSPVFSVAPPPGRGQFERIVINAAAVLSIR